MAELNPISSYTGKVQTSNITVLDNVQYSKLESIGVTNAVLSVVDEGYTGVRVIHDQDTHWIAYNTNDVAVTGTATEIVSVTLDDAIPQDRGAFGFICKCSNTSNTMGELVVVGKKNGAQIFSLTFGLDRNESHKLISLTSALFGDGVAGDGCSVEVYETGGTLTIEGASFGTKIDIVRAAEFATVDNLSSYAVAKSNVIDMLVTGGLGRSECITAFKQLPNFDWSKDRTFGVYDTSGPTNLFFVVYLARGATDEATAGKFFKERMSQAT